MASPFSLEEKQVLLEAENLKSERMNFRDFKYL